MRKGENSFTQFLKSLATSAVQVTAEALVPLVESMEQQIHKVQRLCLEEWGPGRPKQSWETKQEAET